MHTPMDKSVELRGGYRIPRWALVASVVAAVLGAGLIINHANVAATVVGVGLLVGGAVLAVSRSQSRDPAQS